MGSTLQGQPDIALRALGFHFGGASCRAVSMGICFACLCQRDSSALVKLISPAPGVAVRLAARL